ncbi:MAG: nicotinate-nucleotide--dimethylbenzimidazole phosphoribosyltransferase [Gemmiger sp.]|uniref:nicotinate-nucleotide--dimethylbenzimidazole phosphoribosyltransferase n=1 Tax=Gemmiger sp. TaxID=2049027 RepID=UPI002E75ECB5|nr:nicotinate-nucleotide--dimethylbenzimidazole phosphoribosyltransferase [Gemmiger sp.]MEE0708144.1 nicotinate-nucleotide--dimethylbenzimidazole phosphoribosyltransferase [Gemmiger sp.]
MSRETELNDLLKTIQPTDEAARRAAQKKWAACAKPLESLGILETMLTDIAALTGTAQIELNPRTVLVLCADNGVVAQGVSQSGSEVTGIVAHALAAGQSNVCRMAALANCKVQPVDMGILNFSGAEGVLSCRVGNGTADITKGPAMTRQQAEEAILTGIELVQNKKAAGVKLLATGEMGIGNTTTATAVTCALLGHTPKELTGRGAGLSDAGLIRKQTAIEQALNINRPDTADPVDVLAKVGGFDLAGLCGIFLGGALYRVPVLVDGAISAAAALCAVRLCPLASAAVFASHQSAEPAGSLLLQALHKKPLITAGMRLGEGTGAVAAMPLLDMALAVYRGSTFTDYGMQPYTPQGGF